MRTQAKRRDTGAHERTVRAFISIPEEQYEVQERISAENKASLAWIVRAAIDDHLKPRWPYLPQSPDVEDAQQRSERS